MSPPPPLAVNNAPTKESIWKGVKEEKFRQNVIRLQEVSNGNPGDPKIHALDDWQARAKCDIQNTYRLPLVAEQRIADDLAYIIAKKGEAKTVSAVALEQHPEADGLTIRIAANHGIGDSTIAFLRSMFEFVECCAAGKSSSEQCTEHLLDLVIKLNRDSLHSRMQSRHGKTPRTSRVPLRDEIQKFMRRSSKTNELNVLNEKCDSLCSEMKDIDLCSAKSDQETRSLKTIVKLAYELCTPNGQPLDKTLSSYSLEPDTYRNNSTIRQIHKIGRYWGLCLDLARAATRYRLLFKRVDLQPIPRYQSYTPYPRLTAGGKVTYHVHAEIQLLVFYDFQPTSQSLMPRVLGVSKAACFLCNLFILKHCHFFISKTHGKLYHQWNFPNLKNYAGEKMQEYRQILVWINAELTKAIVVEQNRINKRPDLMESFVHLPPKFLPSATASDAGTVLSYAGLSNGVDLLQRQLTLPAHSDNKPIEVSSENHQDGVNLPDRTLPVSPAANSSTRLPHPSVSPLHAAPDTDRKTTLTTAIEVAAPDDKVMFDSKSSENVYSDDVKQENESRPNSSNESASSPTAHSLKSLTRDLSPPSSFRQEISAAQPFYASTAALHLIFEIDPPARGFVQIAETTENDQEAAAEAQQKSAEEMKRGQKKRVDDCSHPTSSLQETEVDISSLRIDETIEPFRQSQNSPDIVVLKLRQTNGQSLRVQLQWL